MGCQVGGSLFPEPTHVDEPWSGRQSPVFSDGMAISINIEKKVLAPCPLGHSLLTTLNSP